jgi:spore coat protein A, manganese oxidase
MLSKRHFKKCLFMSVLMGLLCPWGWHVADALAAQGTPLPGNKIAQFVDPLPLLSVAGGTSGNMQTVLPSILGGTDSITLKMIEASAKMMPTGFVPANGLPYSGTWVFRYLADSGTGVINGPNSADTYIGPVIVAARTYPTEIKYVNNLTTNHIFWRDWTDKSLHSAFHQIYGFPMPTSGDAAHYPGPVPAVPHLHGGEDSAVIDGGPEAWFLSDQGNFTGVVNTHGSAYYSKVGALSNEAIYRYPNSQIAAPIWFHDHLLGGTRINATFAGLAGAYQIIDPGLVLPTGLHPAGLVNGDGTNLRYSVPLVLQDRMFDTNGQLYFPNAGINPTVHPYWVPEFVGDTIVVNGKVWPYLNVDRQRYRFYVINGSNSRPYDMFLQDLTTGVKGPQMWVIATDGGYLDRPVLINPNATGAQTKAGVQKSLIIMPGERYEVIVDFNDPVWLNAVTAAYRGSVPNPLNLILRNTAPTVLGSPKASTEGRLIQFRVSAHAPTDTSYNPASGTPILTGTNSPTFDNQKIKRLVNPTTGTLGAGVTVNKTRLLELNEVAGLGGPLEVLVNNSKWNGIREDDMVTPIPGSVLVNGNYITEQPKEGEIELWEIVNTTMDKHPIHLHGVQFQILNRQAFDTKAFDIAYAAAFPGGALIPGYGPPLNYLTGNPNGKLGGNPEPVLVGAAVPPRSYEVGWKDTAIMNPGEVTRIVVRFAPQDTPIGTTGYFSFAPNAPSANGQPGYYVWHCHITDHEDNEMMRPNMIVPSTLAPVRTYIQGLDY